MDGVLNETTNTLHKHEPGEDEHQTQCGISYHVAQDYLRSVPVYQTVADGEAIKCGRCFPEAGGY